jgi:succinate dehydrogenase/fumarate reductase flavoprotein subunit
VGQGDRDDLADSVVARISLRVEGGGTVNSYGLIWVGQNHLAQAAGYGDTRDETIAYMRFLGGGSLDHDRMSTFVDCSPEALKFFEACGIHFRVVRGVTDHYRDDFKATRWPGQPDLVGHGPDRLFAVHSPFAPRSF